MRSVAFLAFLLIHINSLAKVKDDYKGPKSQLEYTTPHQAGYSETELKKLEGLLDEFGSSSFLMLYDGKILFEYGDIHKKHLVHSIRKALLNSLIGIEYGKGRVQLDTALSELTDKINFYPPLKSSEVKATVADVLKSRSGVYLPATAESKSMQFNKPERGSYMAGEHYYYNNFDFNFAGVYYEETSGQNIYQAFKEKIAQPIGMSAYEGLFTTLEDSDDLKIPDTDGFYLYSKERRLFPAYHFRMTTHDLALYGQLFLNRGRWGNKQIIPEDWIDLSTMPYSVENEKYGLGYGMLWKIVIPKGDKPSDFYHTGVGVHMLGIYPNLNLVMVHRVDTEHDYSFTPYNLIQIIRQMHSARTN